MDQMPLVAQAKAGNEGAFATLVEPLLPLVFRSAYLILLDGALAQDAVQEALVRAYLNLRSFRDGQPFRPWLHRFVVNEALKAGRSRRRRAAPVAHLPDLPGPPEDDPELAIVGKEEHQQVWAALQALDPLHRTVLVLRYYQELSEVDMAKVLNLPPGTVKSRLHRARHRLQEKLSGCEGPTPARGLFGLFRSTHL